jgi:hypothetical protein
MKNLIAIDYRLTNEKGNWFVFLDKLRYPIDNENLDFDEKVNKNMLLHIDTELIPVNINKWSNMCNYDGIRIFIETENTRGYNMVIDYLWEDVIDYSKQIDCIDALTIPINVEVNSHFDIVNQKGVLDVRLFIKD